MFGPEVDAAIIAHSKATPDIEICGYVSAEREFVPLQNLSAEPDKSFVIQHGALPSDALAIVHSHPDGPFHPSEADMQQQLATALPWGICAFDSKYTDVFWFGDGAPIPPLVGRGFRHGVTDCYSLIRDFYKIVHSIDLPEFPRAWEWWNNDGAALYLDGFQKAGFYEVPIRQILPGDVFIATVGGRNIKSANHAGVYLGNGLILHHAAGRHNGFNPFKLSMVEGGARYMDLITKVVRHENDNLDRTVGQTIRT